MPPELAVIVPVLDEAARLPYLIGDLRRQERVDCEIILGDGGSRDGSREIAAALGVAWIDAPTGRAAQMNRAAAHAAARFLLFLHADSRLTRDDQLYRALETLRAARRPGADDVAGHFSLRFDRKQHGHVRLYRYMEAKSNLNRPGTFNGDQGLLLSAEFFRALGGFDERLPFMEDQRIGQRIHARGQWVTLPDPLRTSARRFEDEGLYRRYLLMGVMMGCEHAGMHEFFDRAPQVYRTHAESRRLVLSPFLDLLAECLRSRPPARRRQVWRAVGAYVGDNLWQPFFMRDALGDGPPQHTPWLDAFDRHLGKRLAWPPMAAMLGLATRILLMGLLRPWLRWSERDT